MNEIIITENKEFSVPNLVAIKNYEISIEKESNKKSSYEFDLKLQLQYFDADMAEKEEIIPIPVIVDSVDSYEVSSLVLTGFDVVMIEGYGVRVTLNMCLNLDNDTTTLANSKEEDVIEDPCQAQKEGLTQDYNAALGDFLANNRPLARPSSLDNSLLTSKEEKELEASKKAFIKETCGQETPFDYLALSSKMVRRRFLFLSSNDNLDEISIKYGISMNKVLEVLNSLTPYLEINE